MQVYKCSQCQSYYPSPCDFCGHCGNSGSINSCDLPDQGEIVTFTKVHKGAGQLAEPYTIAVIQLAMNYQVLARIESDSALYIGQKVKYLRSDEYVKIFCA